MADDYVQVDETPIDCLAPGNGKASQGYLWTGCRPRGDVFYHWVTGRAAACLDNNITVNFHGTAQCDGDSASMDSNLDALKCLHSNRAQSGGAKLMGS